MWKRACPLPHVLPLLIYTTQVGFQAAVLLILILILGAPLNHAGRKDAGLAARGQGWPIAATRAAVPECGHTEH
ncbi:hypothetical protein SAMN04515675_0947 [Pseudomonas costantinii]|uniref:Uncharacterized protein n=2 Tax=Pseudomonas costantinii TaxID=168469 RepID=A0A1S2UG12_9PSED|nr:hypothetical protein BFL40_27960 [Pseudomonas costantinii]SED38857.1 hypothetical protein SAMN04515675_0947 [Pseudomonas costantinii]